MSADKYPSIFLRLMEAFVYLFISSNFPLIISGQGGDHHITREGLLVGNFEKVPRYCFVGVA